MTIPSFRFDQRLFIPIAVAGAVVLVATPPEFMLVVAIALLGAYAGLQRPALGLGLIAASIPVQEAIQLSFGPATLTLTRCVALPFIAAWGVTWLMGKRTIPLTPPLIAWAIVTAVLAISFAAATDRGAWGQEVYRWGIALVIYAIAIDTLRTVGVTRDLIIGIGGGIVFSSIVGAWQILTGAGPATFQAGGVTRVYGFFGEPNPMAAYFEMSVPIIGVLAIWRFSQFGLRDRGTMLLLTVAGLGSISLLLTQSRGGLLGTAAAALVIALLLGKKWRLTALATLAVVGLLIAATPVGRSASDRFVASFTSFGSQVETTPSTWAVQERVAHWKAGLQMLEDHPFSGVGAGNYNANFREETTVWRFRIPRGHAHNDLIQMGAQTGYPGLIAYLAVLFTAGVRLLRSARGRELTRERALAIGALGVLTAVIVHGQFDYLHGLSLNLAFVLALACAEPAAHSLRSGRARLATNRDS
ncbi:O-antigen ligase family protein [soil metagenome]